MVYHVIRQARRQLCSEEELPGQSLIVHWRMPSGVPVRHPLLQGISIGPSNFYTWGCGRRCPCTLGVVRSLLPVEWALLGTSSLKEGAV
jgi:hypothetical protein